MWTLIWTVVAKQRKMWTSCQNVVHGLGSCKHRACRCQGSSVGIPNLKLIFQFHYLSRSKLLSLSIFLRFHTSTMMIDSFCGWCHNFFQVIWCQGWRTNKTRKVSKEFSLHQCPALITGSQEYQHFALLCWYFRTQCWFVLLKNLICSNSCWIRPSTVNSLQTAIQVSATHEIFNHKVSGFCQFYQPVDTSQSLRAPGILNSEAPSVMQALLPSGCHETFQSQFGKAPSY